MSTHFWCYREILRGIGAFANAKATWRVQYFTPRDNVIDLIRQHQADGLILGDLPSEETAKEVATLAPFSVGVCGHFQRREVAVSDTVDVDDVAAGRLAAEQFIDKKHQAFAFIGFESEFWSDERMKGYRARLAEAGHSVSTLSAEWERTTTGRGWKLPFPNLQIIPFIDSLPKPLAVLACNDFRGREIVEACRRVGVRVPEDVAVLGVDDDPLDCQLSHPALSSVSFPWERVGFLAAAQLDARMEGRSPPPCPNVPPTAVVERQSTDNIAITDAEVSSALLYIREHAHLPFGVDDVIAAVPAGRRTLEKRFRAVLGRSVLDEIRRVRFDRARLLLLQTDLGISEVAARSGFDDVSWFSTSFRKITGVSPAAYRKTFRSGSAS
jgi:LacI family transcriptional regulator